MREVLRRNGVSLPSDVARTNDPLAVLEFASGHKDLVIPVGDALIAVEVEAVQLAGPRLYAVEFMAAVRESGKRLAIVSNNGSEAVQANLERVTASVSVEVVIGRAYRRPDLMKPHVSQCSGHLEIFA
ncbi:HAD family hydrolase [Catelliglobosispora koreensis]|uniref:HAD family hydrolase n=1 Tax=Catelliglobosispora koreensis TaxID=129052 RepID=UPI0012FA405E|nr:HAD family hydrolase [Catelliglobosispora koreensis]